MVSPNRTSQDMPVYVNTAERRVLDLILLHIEFQKLNTVVKLMSMLKMIFTSRTSVFEVSVWHKVNVENRPIRIRYFAVWYTCSM